MQEKGKVTFALNGECLVGSEDVVPLSGWTDLLEGGCGQSKRQRSECFLDGHIASQPPGPRCPGLTRAIRWAALAPRAPGLANAAATELAGEACVQRVLALMLRAHQAETQALLLWLVCCRGRGRHRRLGLNTALVPLPGCSRPCLSGQIILDPRVAPDLI